MNESSQGRTCPSCGSRIPEHAPEGLCPKCLLEEVAATTLTGSDAGIGTSPPPLEVLKQAFPQLEILEFIAQGGMGFVFKARQLKLNRLVALKILPEALARDAAFAERFAREGQLLARLSHPNVVTVHDFGQVGGFFYLLMEYVDGVNLRQAMRTSRFTAQQALNIVPSICAALQYAHEEGVLHRDIKPENILLDTKGRVKIADFGIAKLMRENANIGTAHSERPVVNEGLTQPGTTPGTPKYMAPEQLETPSDVDHRADIYSLGVVFYEMLTGELPAGRFVPPSRKTPLDPRVDEVVGRALEKQRERRFQSAGEIRTQVEAITGTVSSAVSASFEEVPLAAQGHPIDLSREFSRTLLFGLITLIGLMLNQSVAPIQFLLPQIWQVHAGGIVQQMVIVAGLVGIVCLGFQVWRRRHWLQVPLRAAAVRNGGRDGAWLELAFMGVLLCLSIQVFWNLLSWVLILAQAAQTAVFRTALLDPYGAFSSRQLIAHGSFVLYVSLSALLSILMIVFFVRRELRRSDLISPAPPPAWTPRVILFCVAFSIIAYVPLSSATHVVTIINGGFAATTAFALLTFSRIWRGIALGFLIQTIIMSAIGLPNFLLALGQLPAEAVDKAEFYDPFTWGVVSQLANLIALSALTAVLLLPNARAAFGLKRARVSPPPPAQSSPAAKDAAPK